MGRAARVLRLPVFGRCALGVNVARFSATLAQQIFPPLLIHLIGSGERSGELPAMLSRAATAGLGASRGQPGIGPKTYLLKQ